MYVRAADAPFLAPARRRDRSAGHLDLAGAPGEIIFARIHNYTIFVYYLLMKNVTVTLDEKTAAWARVYAARQGMSLSRFLGDILHRTMRESREYEDAMRRYLEKGPVQLSQADRPYPSREALHDRARLR